MAVALVFAFLTFEAIRQGVTNAVITGFGVTVVALAGAAACLAWLAHREEIVSHRRLRSLAATDAQWRAAQRKRTPLPVLFKDIDPFVRTSRKGWRVARALPFTPRISVHCQTWRGELRTSRGASIVATFPVRARSGMTASMRVSRDELLAVTRGDRRTMPKAPGRQRTPRSDQGEGYRRTRQAITAALHHAANLKDYPSSGL
ncbi:hypothetical protein [Paraburkholderia sp. HP33-1]|uniref:hypothetical protein n=1 Tax=Paraburkholderia sp. HP33-1 TaxID=2883243 RepID=UPI001F2CC1D0|nr:hypothetical protein [Paraburkholderia sp. HP33-1]